MTRMEVLALLRELFSRDVWSSVFDTDGQQCEALDGEVVVRHLDALIAEERSKQPKAIL